MLSSFKVGGAIFFSKRSRVNEWQPVTAEEVFVVLALFMLMVYCIEAQPEILFVTKSTC
jgi:hypothetical protein